MKMEVRLHQRLEQRQQLSQQMLANLELLQCPILELRQKIDEELASNPALELAEGEEPAEPEAGTRTDQDEDPKQDFLEVVEEEWLESERRGFSARSSGDEEERFDALENAGAPALTLQDHLRTQLALIDIDADLRPYIETLISHLNDHGYLSVPLEDMAETLPEPLRAAPREERLRRLEAALSFLQKMDPPGVGARNAKECLLLQLDETDPDYAATRRLIEHHLEDIGHNRLPKMARDIAADPLALADFGYKAGTAANVLLEDIKALLPKIRKLNPKPGLTFSGKPAPRVFPEVVIREVDGSYEIVIDDSWLPPIALNRNYQEMLKDKSLGKVERDYLRRKLEAGRRLISAIEQRRHTIRRITAEILRHQRNFFEHGAEHLKPLKMQDVADAVGIHVSTVSRAISGKWIETPRGIFPMKFFFALSAPKQAAPKTGVPAPATPAPAEEERTRLALMEKIREIVDGEDKSRPLADLEIVKILRQQGLPVARRTVAKYREELGIPSSRQRRTY